jgi:hypothetical protein
VTLNIRTGSFDLCGRLPDAVGIAGRAPDWYTGRQYKRLAPKFWIWSDYQKDHDASLYTERFYEHVLGVLDPASVVTDIGPGAILCCWEPAGLFCHRRLVAAWIEQHTGEPVPDIDTENAAM